MDSLHEPATAAGSAESPVEAAQAEDSNLDQQRPSFSSPDRYQNAHPPPANTKASMISSSSLPPVTQPTTTASMDALPWEQQHQQETPVSSGSPSKTNGSNNSNGVLPLPPGAAPSVANRYSDPHMVLETDGSSRRRQQQQQGSSSEQAQGSSQQQQQPQPLPTRPQRSTSAPLLSGDELAKPRTSGSRSNSSRRPSPSPVRPPYDRESSSNSTPRAGGAPPPPIDPRIELDPHIPAMPSQMLAHGPRHPSLPHGQLQQQLNSTSSPPPINGNSNNNINAVHHSILAASSPSSSPYPTFPPPYDIARQTQHHQQQSSSATATGAGGIVGSSNSPSPYAIPVSPTPRASAQFPTYVVSPGPMPTSYVPQQPQQQPLEEVCVECAMRDQDMADVDATSPGVWDRESDIHYRELVRLDAEEDAKGIPHDPQRPRLKGNKLIEPNLKLWLSMNPREPQARAQTVDKYVRSQILLLEAEAVARARAMQESRELDNRMRDAYSQLRRSAYETGTSATPIDDLGGVRLRNPSGSGAGPYGATTAAGGAGVHGRNASRDVTLLENGMIVEHVDVRKEERQRRRQERNAARKSSRASASGDVLSLVSTNNSVSGGLASPLPTPIEQYGTPTSGGSMPPLPHTPLSPHPGFVGGAMMRPASGPPDLHLPRAVSQASFSDVQSVMSASPRRSRFFGMRNLSMVSGWKSQDSLAPSGISGSMVDMHVVLQRDSRRTASPSDQRPRAKSLLNNLAWSPLDTAPLPSSSSPAPLEASTLGSATLKPKKKRGGIAKIWRIVTGSNTKGASSSQQQQQPQMQEHHHQQVSVVHPNSVAVASSSADDDLPLAPPPPLSYLVDRSGSSNQHQHSPGAAGVGVGSPPSASSPRPSAGAQTFSSSAASLNGRVSPPTAPSSLLPSPTSSRVIDRDSGLIIADSGSSSGGGSGVGRKQSAGNTDMLGEVERLDVLAEERSSFNGSVAGGGKRAGVPTAVHAMTSEPDMRMRTTSSPSLAVNGGAADVSFQSGFVGNPYANGQLNSMAVPRQGAAMHMQTYQQQRPQSSLAVLMSRDKSLPPLPPGEGSSGSESNGTGTGPRPPLAQPEVRPRTVFTYGDHQAIPPGASPPRFEALMAAPAGSSAPFLLSSSNASAAMAMSPVDGGAIANDRHLFQPPRAPFSHQTPRRQSFSGISGSRPVGVGPGAAATMSGRGGASMSGSGPQEQRQFSIRPQQLQQQQHVDAYGAPYDEFGDSRLSLMGYDPVDAGSSRRTLQQQQHQQPTKRKSKFGFASLLGRKSQSQDASDYGHEKAATMQRNETMSMMSGNAYTLDTHSHTQSSVHPASQSQQQQQQGKMSLASRKAIESLVEQDAEFVAYRYPSADQSLVLR